jgi:hypothetical protein
MNDCVNLVLCDQLSHKGHIASVALDENGTFVNKTPETGGEVIENDHLLALVHQRVNHMASDISRATCDENRHAPPDPDLLTFPATIPCYKAKQLGLESAVFLHSVPYTKSECASRSNGFS